MADPSNHNHMGDDGGNLGYPPKGYALSGKIILSAVVIFFFVVFLMLCLHLYARWYLLRARRLHLRRSRHRRTHLVFYVDPSNPHVTAPASRGLDSAVLTSLPVFVYSSKTCPDSPTECAVCLSEFEEKETGRVLPNCNHSFHIDCIDMWFHSHATCPLCRSPVEPLNETPASSPSEIIEIGPSPGFYATCRHEDTYAETSASTSSFGDRRKPPGVTIEVPVTNGSFDEESAATHSFRSPVSRMLSFKRILSRERRASVSPSSCGAPPMPEVDVETGRDEPRASRC